MVSLEAQKIKRLVDNAGIPLWLAVRWSRQLVILATASFALAESITVTDLGLLDWIAKDLYNDYLTFDELNIILKDNIK